MRRIDRLYLVALLIVAGCAGRSTSPASISSPASAEFPALELAGFTPPLPESQPFAPQRMAASAQFQVKGSDTYAISPANAVPEGTGLSLQSALNLTAAKLGWGMYRFIGAPGERLDAVGYNSIIFQHPSGQHIWLGISNYSEKRWEWFDSGISASAQQALTRPAGTYVSPGGQTYVLMLACGGMQYKVNEVHLSYAARQDVTGTVQEEDGTPIAGALVASTAFQVSALTDSAGHYLIDLPKGTWPLVATKDGYTFYSNPAAISVNAAPVSGPAFIGRHNGSHFEPGDPNGNDDTVLSAATIDLASGPVDGSMSATGDAVDCLSFTVPTPGRYSVQYSNPDQQIYFPFMKLLDPAGNEITYGSSPVSGACRLTFLAGEANSAFVLRLACGGGGGDYQLTLDNATCQHLQCQVQTSTAQAFPGCILTATTAGGQTTNYMTDSGGVIDDATRAPETTTIVPSGMNWNFSPTQLPVNLTSGPQLNNAFTGTAAALTDSLEPNGTALEADDHAQLTLPYDSDGAGQPLSLTQGGDFADFYRIAPTAGQGVKAEVLTTNDHAVTQGLTLDLLSDDGRTNKGNSYWTPSGLEARLSLPAEAHAYYIRVGMQGSPVGARSYKLKVSSYHGNPLSFRVKLGAVGIPNAIVQLRRPVDAGSNQAYFVHQYQTNIGGATPPELYAPGEQIQAELLRYGLDTDRQTQLITMPDSSVAIIFAADPALSGDSCEPNDSLTTAYVPTLPAALSATLDPVTDPHDFYKVTLSATDAVELKLSQPEPQAGKFPICLRDSINFIYSFVDVASGGAPVVLSAPAAGTYFVDIQSLAVPSRYNLELSTGPAYHLKGSMTKGGGAAAGSLVYCPELGRIADFDLNTGRLYDFGLVPPGTYTLLGFANGATVSPPQAQITIATADSGEDFIVTGNVVDNYEPNDDQYSAGLGGPALDGTPLLPVSVGGSDQFDCYQVSAAAGKLVTFHAKRDQLYMPRLQFAFWESTQKMPPAMPIFDVTFHDTGTEQTATLVIPATGKCVMQIGGGPAPYTLWATVGN